MTETQREPRYRYSDDDPNEVPDVIDMGDSCEHEGCTPVGPTSAVQGAEMTLLTVAQVAEALQVKPEFVRSLAARGELKSVRLSSQVLRFRPEDVDALVAAHST